MSSYGNTTEIGFTGTKVATETCGQVRLLNTSMTVWLYWICVYVTGVVLGFAIADVDCTTNCGIGSPGTLVVGDKVTEDPASMAGTSRSKRMVSTQKVAVILVALAFGFGLPRRNAISCAPPPNRGCAAAVEIEMVSVLAIV